MVIVCSAYNSLIDIDPLTSTSNNKISPVKIAKLIVSFRVPYIQPWTSSVSANSFRARRSLNSASLIK